MNKTETIHMRVEPNIKLGADTILNRLGLSTAEAINIFLNQIILCGGLPFDVRLPVPNETTLQAMHEAENDISLRKFTDADSMFRELGI
ncbi:MAG: type II toxin-antitoxin system RelB/DinJ family antitoxin [Lachnospiraceae bacterium]|jgi:DNA-damage-inducible protein J|nr:type II toxin-antitoxin system RelB/DinJ family antitoxin [Lachnospiraceae bacterium]